MHNISGLRRKKFFWHFKHSSPGYLHSSQNSVHFLQISSRIDCIDWNKLILSNDVTVVDVRKSFESEIGTFEKAINPKINDFRKFPEYFEKLSDDKDRKIAMFCTGGIRCEKAASYLFKRGFKNVYQLKGGILNYLNNVPEKKSLWN